MIEFWFGDVASKLPGIICIGLELNNVVWAEDTNFGSSFNYHIVVFGILGLSEITLGEHGKWGRFLREKI